LDCQQGEQLLLRRRGKSYITRKLSKFLNWSGYLTKVFNVGNRRRLKQSKEIGSASPPSSGSVSSVSSQVIPAEGTRHSAAFFDPLNAESVEIRNEAAMETLDELLQWLLKGGKVAIHDVKLCFLL
jgi:6-phosphofructo-2-kinase